MTIEDPTSNNSSPRLSFSRDFIQPDNPYPPPKPAAPLDIDFHFNVGKVASCRDPLPADELFSEGKILAKPFRNPDPSPSPNPNPDPIAGPAKEKTPGKKSLWKFGRSASLNCARTSMINKIKFLRSYSAGSDPSPVRNPKPEPRTSPNPKTPRPKNNGVMSPVPLFPKERGLIGFLLCNCVGGGNSEINGGMEYYCSPWFSFILFLCVGFQLLLFSQLFYGWGSWDMDIVSAVKVSLIPCFWCMIGGIFCLLEISYLLDGLFLYVLLKILSLKGNLHFCCWWCSYLTLWIGYGICLNNTWYALSHIFKFFGWDESPNVLIN